jgi:hypothetical protein
MIDLRVPLFQFSQWQQTRPFHPSAREFHLFANIDKMDLTVLEHLAQPDHTTFTHTSPLCNGEDLCLLTKLRPERIADYLAKLEYRIIFDPVISQIAPLIATQYPGILQDPKMLASVRLRNTDRSRQLGNRQFTVSELL